MKTPWDYKVLINIPKNVADQYIQQLKKELAEAIWDVPTILERNLLGNLEIEPAMTNEEIKNAKAMTAEEKVRNQMNSLIYGLFALIGEEPELNAFETYEFTDVEELLESIKEKLLEECKTKEDEKEVFKSIFNVLNRCELLSDEDRINLVYA